MLMMIRESVGTTVIANPDAHTQNRHSLALSP